VSKICKLKIKKWERYKFSILAMNPFLASLKALKFVVRNILSISPDVYPHAKNVAHIDPADVPANLHIH
jgi:hypothetical protein